MNIPPIIGSVISLTLGVVVGATVTYQYIDKKQITANVKQLAKDSVTNTEIKKVTLQNKKNNKVKKTLTELSSKKVRFSFRDCL